MDNSYLEQLKDIHMPAKPHWWPVSNQILIALLTLLIAIILIYTIKKFFYDKKSLKKEINKEFSIIKSNFIKTQNKAQLQNDISILLKRIILSSKFDSPSKIFNKNIHDQINIILQTDRFTKNPSIDAELLLRLSSELIKKCRL